MIRNHNDWGIDGLVARLREVRIQSLETRHRRDRPPKLPQRKELHSVVEGLSAVLFPNRLGLPDINDEGIDYFVGHTLDTALRILQQQIRCELVFIAEQNHSVTHNMDMRANQITRAFAMQLPQVNPFG